MEEFSTNADEADIHFKMTSTMRCQNESISEYCFRMNALRRQYSLSETVVVKYTRDGLMHRDVQQAIVPIRFRTIQGLRESAVEYLASMANCATKNNTNDETPFIPKR